GIEFASAIQGTLRIYGHVRGSGVCLSEFTWRAHYQIGGNRRDDLLSLCGVTGDRVLRVADPLAPGAGVESRTLESGHFHGEQVLAGGHARAAHADRGIRR